MRAINSYHRFRSMMRAWKHARPLSLLSQTHYTPLSFDTRSIYSNSTMSVTTSSLLTRHISPNTLGRRMLSYGNRPDPLQGVLKTVLWVSGAYIVVVYLSPLILGFGMLAILGVYGRRLLLRSSTSILDTFQSPYDITKKKDKSDGGFVMPTSFILKFISQIVSTLQPTLSMPRKALDTIAPEIRANHVITDTIGVVQRIENFDETRTVMNLRGHQAVVMIELSTTVVGENGNGRIGAVVEVIVSNHDQLMDGMVLGHGGVNSQTVRLVEEALLEGRYALRKLLFTPTGGRVIDLLQVRKPSSKQRRSSDSSGGGRIIDVEILDDDSSRK